MASAQNAGGATVSDEAIRAAAMAAWAFTGRAGSLIFWRDLCTERRAAREAATWVRRRREIYLQNIATKPLVHSKSGQGTEVSRPRDQVRGAKGGEHIRAEIYKKRETDEVHTWEERSGKRLARLAQVGPRYSSIRGKRPERTSPRDGAGVQGRGARKGEAAGANSCGEEDP